MEYHQPDNRWDIFGFKNFEAYVQRAVVKGLFNPCVPKDIIEAFKMAEFMMAHAYYHYPLYHEAFSKVLRIIEMAVKFRCQQLNIPLEFIKKGKKSPDKKGLKMLMDDLLKVEPAKKLKQEFDVARSLRNTTMHPDRHIYSGAITKSYIKKAVSLLNILFLPEKVFTSFQQQLEVIQHSVGYLPKELLVLKSSERKYLLESVNFEAAVLVNDEWCYLLVGHPIMLNTLENLQNHSYLKPLAFFVNKISVSHRSIEALDENTNEIILVQLTDHPTNMKTYRDYLKALQSVTENDRLMYKHNKNHEVGEKENDFWYEKLWKVNNNIYT